MTKVLISLQLTTLAAVALLFAFRSEGGEGAPANGEVAALRQEVREVRADLAKLLSARPLDEPGAAALRREVGAARADTQKVLEALKMLADDFEFLMVDVDGIKRNTWDLLEELKSAGRIGAEPEAPDEYKALFNPETRETLVKRAAEKGVTLLEDRVTVPGVIVQNRAMLEFFAIITGGKEHESVVALTGSFDPKDGRLPEGLAGTINACILALGYEKGTPVSMAPDGQVVPPSGEPIHLYLEWPEDGETIRARAEDLVYDLETKTAMERNKWVYVGSRFERDFGGGSGVVYMADITGDVVATYSWPNTIIDNTTIAAKDDIYYVCYAPRIPPIGTKVTMVFSREELPAKDFPEGGMEEEDGGDSGK